MIREKLSAKQSVESSGLILVVLSLSAATLTGFGPPWAPPVAGMMFSLIGPLMWWHWSRFHRRLNALPAVSR